MTAQAIQDRIEQTYKFALRSKENLAKQNNVYMREQIVYTALGCSDNPQVWMEVFTNDSDMCERFR